MNRYKLDIEPSNQDTYPNDFRCWVNVTDNMTGKEFKRRGYGKFIGNFSPIWITINGVRKQLTEWERETYTQQDEDDYINDLVERVTDALIHRLSEDTVNCWDGFKITDWVKDEVSQGVWKVKDIVENIASDYNASRY